jgi:hypothetical protein
MADMNTLKDLFESELVDAGCAVARRRGEITAEPLANAGIMIFRLITQVSRISALDDSPSEETRTGPEDRVGGDPHARSRDDRPLRRDDEPDEDDDEAPETPLDEPAPMPVQDPPDEPDQYPYTVGS